MSKSAQDNFETYFAEKLWDMIPAVYRDEDGRSERPGVLRALVEILAEQAAVLRRSHDRLWEDQFIELCKDWAVPYLGDLVATRLVSALNKRGRRIDVAKTIYYRRRKGTLRVLEQLINDIAQWEGKVVENFKRLSRNRHGLDPAPAGMRGRFTGTPPGGTADIRNCRVSELTGSAFDEFYYTADVRQQRGMTGLYNIPKLAFYLYRLKAFRIEDVTPFASADEQGAFSCDPSGRDVPLFMKGQRSNDWDEWRSAEEWELPGPMNCSVLSHAEYILNEDLIIMLEKPPGVGSTAAGALRKLKGFRFYSEMRLREVLELLNEPSLVDAAVYREILKESLVDNCGKAKLLSGALSVKLAQGNAIHPVDISAGNLSQWMQTDPGKQLVIDPERGRLQFFNIASDTEIKTTYCYGFSGEIGAGTYNRSLDKYGKAEPLVYDDGKNILAGALQNQNVTKIEDNATYYLPPDILNIKKMTLFGANQKRPYVRLTDDWVLRSKAGADAELIIDGIWFGSNNAFDVILRGDYERVIIRHATFDPGGDKDIDGNPVRPVPLVIEGHVEKLIIENSIMNTINTRSRGVVERIEIKDSILDEAGSNKKALNMARGDADLKRVTVFGRLDVNRVWASESLITGLVDVTDGQRGCFRFSAAPEGSSLPRPYESYILNDVEHIFSSRSFGHPGYGQLSSAAPCEIRRGTENGSEMGVFSNLLNPIKMDGLSSKISEYMPFGLIPLFINKT